MDCGVPNAPIDGFIHYTGTEKGSRAVIECGEGLALEGDGVTHVAVCTVNASWSPDFSSWTCFKTFGGGQCLPGQCVDAMECLCVCVCVCCCRGKYVQSQEQS